jgi:hypothetical protein
MLYPEHVDGPDSPVVERAELRLRYAAALARHDLDYPLAVARGCLLGRLGNTQESAQALSGSSASNSLFRGDPTVNVPLFRSVSDATYHMKFSGANPCGSGAVTFVFRTVAPAQQSAPDETWGVDNISIKTDN